jgi:hypothetical protein
VADQNSGWVFADTWVLSAIGMYRRPCSLTELIAAADMINHAILLDVEVESALGKLTGTGLVRVFDDWTFELTDEGMSLWPMEGRDLWAKIDGVTTHLSAIEPRQIRVSLPEGAMKQALEAYRSSSRGSATRDR